MRIYICLLAISLVMFSCRKEDDCIEPGAYFRCDQHVFIGDTVIIDPPTPVSTEYSWNTFGTGTIVESGGSTYTGSYLRVVVTSSATIVEQTVTSVCGATSTYSLTITGIPHYPGTWTQRNLAPFDGQFGQVSFVIGTRGYMATGFSFNDGALSHLWEWDETTGQWSQKASMPASARCDAVGFALNGLGYVGLGLQDMNGTALNDWWCWDPSTNLWTQKTSFPGGARGGACGVACGSNAYVGMGNNGTFFYSDFWQYDPALDVWTQKTSPTGISRSYAFAFASTNKLYIGGGLDSSQYNGCADFYEYDPAADSWISKSSLPDARWMGASCFTNGTGYTISGCQYYSGFGNMATNAVTAYDVATDTWSQKHVFTNYGRRQPLAFAINNNIYAGMGYWMSYYHDLWQLTP